ncbi:uncharacterized protein LOC123890983 [Trifolium pratense]|uniref:uncharacterized protein LOC123890983 n=1 Tax=Trifolium pratense TaxID=57577 RepID=UPI001E693B17|nr:uncharacterized protein LOC123890983 [Trifolium pratense]
MNFTTYITKLLLCSHCVIKHTTKQRMSLVTEEIKLKSEVYHGHQICELKYKELLKVMALPNNLLPLKDIKEVGYNKETGFVWLKQNKSIIHKFEKIGKLVSYAAEMTAHIEHGKVKKLNGVKTKELLIWITLSDIYVDDPPIGSKITCKTPLGLSKTFPLSAFEVEEEKSSDVQRKYH